jgi:hypothetical protein
MDPAGGYHPAASPGDKSAGAQQRLLTALARSDAV